MTAAKGWAGAEGLTVSATEWGLGLGLAGAFLAGVASHLRPGCRALGATVHFGTGCRALRATVHFGAGSRTLGAAVHFGAGSRALGAAVHFGTGGRTLGAAVHFGAAATMIVTAIEAALLGAFLGAAIHFLPTALGAAMLGGLDVSLLGGIAVELAFEAFELIAEGFELLADIVALGGALGLGLGLLLAALAELVKALAHGALAELFEAVAEAAWAAAFFAAIGFGTALVGFRAAVGIAVLAAFGVGALSAVGFGTTVAVTTVGFGSAVGFRTAVAFAVLSFGATIGFSAFGLRTAVGLGFGGVLLEELVESAVEFFAADVLLHEFFDFFTEFGWSGGGFGGFVLFAGLGLGLGAWAFAAIPIAGTARAASMAGLGECGRGDKAGGQESAECGAVHTTSNGLRNFVLVLCSE